MISIIIPLAPNEPNWQRLVHQVEQHYESLTSDFSSSDCLYEILLCSPQNLIKQQSSVPSDRVKWVHVECSEAQAGLNPRALALNAGAKLAQYPFLWFLHADSFLPENVLSQLIQSLKKNPKHFHYFQLAFMPFQSVGLKERFVQELMRLNALGANVRSKLFHAPFGDQGFCLHRELFERLQGYPVNCLYGEDHLLTLQAKFLKIPFNKIPIPLLTSARKYMAYGWLKITLQHQYLWWKQRYLFQKKR